MREQNKLANRLLDSDPLSLYSAPVNHLNDYILIAEVDELSALNIELELQTRGYPTQLVSTLDDLTLHLVKDEVKTILISTQFVLQTSISPQEPLSETQVYKISQLLIRLKQVNPHIGIIFWSSEEDEKLAVTVLKAGADDFISIADDKKTSFDLLGDSINGLDRRKQQKSQLSYDKQQPGEAIDADTLTPASQKQPQENFYWTDFLPVGAMVIGKNLQIKKANATCQRMLGYSSEEICGFNLEAIVPRRLVKELQMYINTTQEENKPSHFNKILELTLLKADGEHIPVRCTFRKLNLSLESPYVLIVEDISEEMDFRANYYYQQKWDLLFSSYSQYFITLPVNKFQPLIKKLLSAAGQLLACQRVSLYFINPQPSVAKLEFEWCEKDAKSLSEFSNKIYFSKEMPEIATMLKGQPQILYPQKKSKMAKLTQCLGVSEHLAHVGSISSYIAPLVYQSQVFGWLGFDFEYAPRQWETSEREHLVTLVRIVNRALNRKKYEEIRQLTHAKLVESNTKLNRQASIDKLTQLANRRYFDHVLEEEIRRASRDNSLLCVIFCDIDYFKNYNDCYGHVAGDNCLKKISQILKQSFQRAGDFVARYGGEEFAIILPRIDYENAFESADKMRRRLFNLDLPHRGSPLGRISLSAGVTCLKNNCVDSMEDLISGADKALYRAKQHGRNRVFIYERRQF